MEIRDLIKERVLVLDGAMGTMLQRKGFTGNFDALCLTHPDDVADVHRQYLEAGADIIETNSFSSQRISQAEYGMADKVREMNRAAAQIARREADRMTSMTPDKPRFVAGSIGPTNQSCSISPDIDNPALRSINFDTMCDAYAEQMTALIEGGVDTLLIETIFDTLNAKAALAATEKAFSATGKKVPVMLSATLADQAGRLLSGQTLEAFLISVQHADIFSLGLNCSFGAEQMAPFLKRLAAVTPYYISAYPNAGLPNEMGEYEQTPEQMAECVKKLLDDGLVNIIGGCCGTTPEHVRAISGATHNSRFTIHNSPTQLLTLAGQDEFVSTGAFINVGERCNVAGSRKFLRLIAEKQYDEALQIARKQVADGAMILDINMDDGMLDTKNEMVNFLCLMGSDPEVARVPWMIDSSQFDVIEAALKCIQGKAIVNSLSLKEGEEIFLTKAKKIQQLGAALIVMAFDEEGQATTYERKIRICQRAYNLLTEKLDFHPSDIIFDPNILTVATGMKEHDRYAIDFIDTCHWIHENLPGARVSGGVSNLSFAFRGNNYLREAMHAVFLYHAINAGLDMAIVNPSSKVMYQDIPQDLLETIEDVILCRREDATERLVALSQQFSAQLSPEEKGSLTSGTSQEDVKQSSTVSERLVSALRKGSDDHLKEDIEDALKEYPSPSAIIEGPLMDGMRKVGELFGEGKMFLPQVIKTARTMKNAISLLEPHINSKNQEIHNSKVQPTYLLATVKGDVHDIGKNIAAVVLACNDFRVIDLGVMVPAETIVETAKKEHADFICLSGLITPSLKEMCNVASELKKAGISVPLFISGATTSEIHTALKIAPLYDGPVFHLKDASQNPVIATQLMGKDREQIIDGQNQKNISLQEASSQDTSKGKDKPVVTCSCCHPLSHTHIEESNRVATPSYLGIRNFDINIKDIRPYINWIYFHNLWKVKDDTAKSQLQQEAEQILDSLEGKYSMKASVGFYKASGKESRIVCGDTIIDVPPRLADYVGKDDHIGVFAITVCPELADKMQGDIMLQSLCDRLAEATSEYMHAKVRHELWGYAKDENLTIDEMFKARYQGIRPAVGYSSLPDQSQIFQIAKLLDFTSIGIRLTENGAMFPQSSVCGLYIANPEAKYF